MIGAWRSLARAGYWVLVGLVFVLSVAPIPPDVGVETTDKVNHFAAFYVLALCAALLFPRRPLWFAAALLVGYGGLIEIVQGLSFVGRDRDLLDWLTDMAAVACALVPLALSRLRVGVGDDKPTS
jgi:VanZ family protein